ncbi:MAG: hypothetical protein FH756_00365 [Firmicutes bacterium]|nr:hypothetical protein [Bacillota bacterium]
MAEPYLLLFIAILAVPVSGLIYFTLSGIISSTQGLWKNRRNLKGADTITNWMLQVEKHLKRRKSRLKASMYVILLTFAVITGFFSGIILNNPLAAILIAAIGFVIPEQIFLYIILRQRLVKFDQLVEACPVFASELQRVHLTRALGNTGRSIPDPVGRIFRQAERDLIATNEPKEALGRMMRHLDFYYGRDFISRAYDCYYNSAVAPMFIDLGQEMESKRKRLHENIAKLFQDRLLSVAILLMFFPAYTIAAGIVPTTWEFMTQTVAGKFLICLYLLSVALGPMMDYTTIRKMEV